MLFEIENSRLRVAADTLGAQLMSIRSAGLEYLWQADPAYWKDRAPNIFPYVARLTDGRYTYRGRSYSLPIHGFAPRSDFELDSRGSESMVFRLESGGHTLEMYPFRFAYFITYRLDGNTLRIENRVENHDEKTMYFGLGGHPGINVPLDDGLSFEDYFLEFAPCPPRRIEFTSDCFITGRDEPFPLENNRLPLRHSLFDNDAIVLRGLTGPVTLRSEHGAHSVTLNAPDFPVLGFWHRPGTDAPYVCLEPWSSLPSRSGVVEDLETQPNLISLPAGQTYKTEWSLKFL